MACPNAEGVVADELLAFRRRSAERVEQAAPLPAAKSDTRALSLELDKLLNAADPQEKDAAWQAFVRRYSRLLLHTAHSHSRSYDCAMDRYAFVLERLRHDDCRRLRLYLADGRTTFPTWLVVVTNRLCVDYARQLYGRKRATKTKEDTARETTIVRQRLVDQIWADVDLGGLQDVSSCDPERRLRESELKEALAGATRELQPRDRLLLQLKFEEGMSAREIAETMRYPSPFHVYGRLRSLMRELRRTLSDRGIGGPTP